MFGVPNGLKLQYFTEMLQNINERNVKILLKNSLKQVEKNEFQQNRYHHVKGHALKCLEPKKMKTKNFRKFGRKFYLPIFDLETFGFDPPLNY